jgi:hypothetical protein
MKIIPSGRVTAALFVGMVAGLIGAVVLPFLFRPASAQAPQATPAPTNAVNVAALRAELDAAKAQLPDQAHAMADAGYHFANLWFAGQRKNWPLAKFYLDETRSHLSWAVRLKPIRKTSAGLDIDLRGILQSLENTQLTAVHSAIEGKDADQFSAAYRLTLEACYACHKTSEKPYLRPQVPEQPDAHIINFDPNAKWPE